MIPSHPRVLLALDSFKGSLRSLDVAEAIRAGMLSEGFPEERVRCVAVGDGGEGTLEALESALGATRHLVEVQGPDGDPVSGSFLVHEGVAWVESASACGLEITAATSPGARSTTGVGELLHAALQRGATDILLGCGGSSTIDLGLGMLEALGTRIDLSGPRVREGAIGLSDLPGLLDIDLSAARARFSGLRLRAAVDVRNPLVGEGGAAEYALQKGLDPAGLRGLIETLDHAASILDRAAGSAISLAEGAGAAGGLGAAVLALGGELTPGFDAIASWTGLDEALGWAEVVVTGEGRLDETTARGKVVHQILSRTRGGPRVWVVAGQASVRGRSAAIDAGAVLVMTLVGEGRGDDLRAMGEAPARLEQVGRQLARALSP